MQWICVEVTVFSTGALTPLLMEERDALVVTVFCTILAVTVFAYRVSVHVSDKKLHKA